MDSLNLLENEEIETLFKVEPPLTTLPPPGVGADGKEYGGFGYLGVLLRNKKTDRLQCHICRKWFLFLATHLLKHKIKPVDYRIRFQLPLSFPLCGLKISRHGKDQALKWFFKNGKHISKGKRFKKGHKLVGLHKRSHKYASTNMAWKNMHGTCDEQLNKRY
ncbi:MAG: hypothetical protein AAB815_01760, partial [Patescibacteria group bacterium]